MLCDETERAEREPPRSAEQMFVCVPQLTPLEWRGSARKQPGVLQSDPFFRFLRQGSQSRCPFKRNAQIAAHHLTQLGT